MKTDMNDLIIMTKALEQKHGEGILEIADILAETIEVHYREGRKSISNFENWYPSQDAVKEVIALKEFENKTIDDLGSMVLSFKSYAKESNRQLNSRLDSLFIVHCKTIMCVSS